MTNNGKKKRGGFTLVEIMIVVAIITLLAMIAVPAWLRSRKRTQASRVINDLRLISAAVDQYAVEYSKMAGAQVDTPDWTAYMKKGTALYSTAQDIFGHTYGMQTVDSEPKVPLATWNALSDVASTDFFSPFEHY
jgi:prepilin-type N-terminal cleavage/methylation domain-containing protein